MNSKHQNIKAIIFDLDGTLADTIDAITEAVNMTMNRFGYTERTCDEVRRAIGNGARLLIKRLMPSNDAANNGKLCEVLEYYDAMYAKTYMHTERCYDGVRDAVIKLAQNGFKIAILSNKQDAYVKELAKILLPVGTVSEAHGQTDLPTKPDPTVPLMIAERLGVPPFECAFVGDSDVDIMTAKNAGMLQLSVSWGFRQKSFLISSGAENIVDTPSEMLDFFL